jgi:hypothetical protein
MKLELEDVKQRVDRKESDLAGKRDMMQQWQKMLDLDPGFSMPAKDSVVKFGKEYVVTPDPLNVVNKAVQLLPDAPKVDIPQRENADTERRSAETREKFLTAMYPRINEQSGVNLLKKLGLGVFSRGIGYVEVLWIRDLLPEKLRKKAFPFSIRTLDPLEVGLHRGPYYVEYAYHKYRMMRIDARQKYPDLELWRNKRKMRDSMGRYTKDEDMEVDIIDYWHRDEGTGAVWHCLIVDEEFQIAPIKTNYPFIPIIEANGDNGQSILHAINGLWQYKCRLASTIGTAVLGYVFPQIVFQTETGQIIDDFEVRALGMRQVPWGTKVEVIKPDVNLPLLNDMLQKVDVGIQQSTFPSVLYGDAGSMQAGYGVNILSQHASGRVFPVRESLERCLQEVHTLVLAMIEEMDDDDEGVELFGKDESTNKPYHLCLKKADIDGQYENQVTLVPNVPQDDMQRITLGLQLAAAKIVSKDHIRKKYLSIDAPTDEQDFIDFETALESPELSKKWAVVAAMKRYPETWPAILEGTPLLDIAMKIDLDLYGLPVPAMLERQAQLAMIGDPTTQGPPMPPMPPPGLQGPGLAGPQGGGFPPAMMGQIEPENIGLPPAGNPAIFANAMGSPLSPMDAARALDSAPPMI